MKKAGNPENRIEGSLPIQPGNEDFPLRPSLPGACKTLSGWREATARIRLASLSWFMKSL